MIFFPYFALIMYAAYMIIKHRFKRTYLINALALVTTFFLFAIAYNSGNLLNALGFTIYFALIFNLVIIEES